MKVYSRAEFLKLPSGTLFCKGEPWAFGGMQVKGDTLDNCNDFFCLGLEWVDASDSGEATDRLEEMLRTGASYPMEESFGRDGCFDVKDVFLVYEMADLERLAVYLQRAMLVVGRRSGQ